MTRLLTVTLEDSFDEPVSIFLRLALRFDGPRVTLSARVELLGRAYVAFPALVERRALRRSVQCWVSSANSRCLVPFF